MEKIYDYAIVGGGLVGLSSAWALITRQPKASIILIDKEPDVAMHQSGRNSGVLHSGIYYRRGSLKADLTVRGRKMMIDFCTKYGILYDLCGKLILAVDETEFSQIEELHQRGLDNRLDVKVLDQGEISKIEPHASGLKAIWIPETGIVDFRGVAHKLRQLLSERVEFLLEAKVGRVENNQVVKLETNNAEVCARRAINCAGLFSDRLARKAGTNPGLRIIPFRGEYFRLRQQAKHLVTGLIYPLADRRLPFLGVHLTRTIDGEVLVGPNAVLALHREGYHAGQIRMADMIDSLGYAGFWRLVAAHIGAGLGEMFKAWSMSAFTRAARKLVPELKTEDFVAARAGVRAQAVDAKGNLVDDFRFVRTDKWFHVLNAPSPAATACFAIGEVIAEQI